MRQYGEWTFYPEGSHYGKRCYIDGERKGNCQTYRETTLVDVIGRTKKGREYSSYSVIYKFIQQVMLQYTHPSIVPIHLLDPRNYDEERG